MSETRNTGRKATGLLKTILITGIVALIIAEGWFGYQVHDLSGQRVVYKKAYAFVNSISFGLLSVDVWRDQVVDAASDEIHQFRLTPEQENDIRKQINASLHGMVDQAFESINQPQKGLGNKIKKLAVKTIVDPKAVHAEVPGFTDKLMKEITRPSSYQRIANIADTLVAQMGRKIYDSSLMGTQYFMDSIYKAYDGADKAAFEKNITAKMELVKESNWKYTYCMIGCAAVVLLLMFIGRKKVNLQGALTVLAVISALVLLLVGITTSIIEIDALIDHLELHLVSKAVSFKNQDLFFQSQSILEICRLLIGSGRVDSAIVGIMILLFSVLFPLVIMASIAASRLKKAWAKSKTVFYFSFQAGKWDMSNVMVVAILMTFIGFNGIVDSTLSSLNFSGDSMSSLTSNKTSIQPGYIIYIAFVIFSFSISAMFRKICQSDVEAGMARECEVVEN